MANTYTQIYIQVVFSVEGRMNILPREHKEELHHYITRIVTSQKQKIVAINSMPDHVLIGLKSDMALSNLVGKIKSNQEGWFQRFKIELPDMVGTWNDFRVDEITKILVERLKQALISVNSFSAPSLETAASALHKMRLRATQNRALEARTVRVLQVPTIEKSQNSNAIKNLAVKAVSRMSDSEIRKIWLPLGSIFDAMN